MVEIQGDHLVINARRVALREVRAVEEAYNPWTGLASARLHGPGAVIDMSEGYARLRPELRVRLREVPWVSAWAFDGRFPGPVLGLPPSLAHALVGTFGVATVWGLTVQAGLWTGMGLAVGLLLWVALARRVVVVRPDGLRVGPVWAELIPWHEVQAVGLDEGTLQVATRYGLHRAAVCDPLLPALRGRLRRLGGWDLDETSEGSATLRDTGRLVPAAMLTWILLAAAALGAVFGLDWWWVAVLLSAALLTGLVAEAIHAQLRGWGGGAIVLLLLATTAASYAVAVLRWWPV